MHNFSLNNITLAEIAHTIIEFIPYVISYILDDFLFIHSKTKSMPYQSICTLDPKTIN